jgi:hypothetical protein
MRDLRAVGTDGLTELFRRLFSKLPSSGGIEILHAMESVFLEIPVAIPAARMPDVGYERECHEFEGNSTLHSQNT